MKTRLLSLALAVCMILAIFPVAVLAEDTAVHIKTAEEFAAITENGSYILDNDIDLSKTTFKAIKKFTGKLDGNGYTIKLGKIEGSSVDGSNTTAFGLFSYIYQATICNLNIEGTIEPANAGSDNSVGAVAGCALSSIIFNCTSSIDVTGFTADKEITILYVGGLVGQSPDTDIANSCYYGTGLNNVTASNIAMVGGLTGYTATSNIVNCYSTADAMANATTAYAGVLAGFIGKTDSTNVKYCYIPSGFAAIGNEDHPAVDVTELPDSQIIGDTSDIGNWENVTISDVPCGILSLGEALNFVVDQNASSDEFGDVKPQNWTTTGGVPLLIFGETTPVKPTISGSTSAVRTEGYEAFTVTFTHTEGSELNIKNSTSEFITIKDNKLCIPANLTHATYTITLVAVADGIESEPLTFTLIITPASSGGEECPHANTEWREVTAATYTSTGLERLYCKDCHTPLDATREIPMLERSFVFDISFLTFDTNGGSELKTLTTLFGARINLKEFSPVRDGYEFIGWFADEALTQPIDNVQVIGVTTVYAGWEEESLSFTDVDKDDPYYSDIKYVFDNDLMVGTSEITFSPDLSLNRAMVVTILWRMNGNPTIDYLMTFEDVADNEYYTEAVRWAASEEIVKGISATEFAPLNNITREQLAAIIYRYVQKNGGGFTGAWYFPLRYNDIASISEYADEAIHWCVMNGILEADANNNLRPTEAATRAETAHAFHILSTIEF